MCGVSHGKSFCWRYHFTPGQVLQVAHRWTTGIDGRMKQRLVSGFYFLSAVWGRINDGHFGLIAAGVAFYAMFAVFPGLAASVAIFSLMADPKVIEEYLDVGEQFLPTDAALLIHNQVMGLLSTPRTTLGWATFVSLMIALYSARAGVSALITGLDVVNRATSRGWVWGWVADIGLTLALIFAIVVGLATIVLVPLALNYINLGPAEEWFLGILPWVAMFVLVLSCLSILYHFGPNLPSGNGRPRVSVGVVVAALTWSAVSFAFSAYLANFDSYNRIYGSIGAVVALLMWLYLGVLAVLLGGAVNAELTSPKIRTQKLTAPELKD
ncbi:YihY/virulence factor BrkB family protein [Pseudotabrizicola sediminis]|uniref:YihY/virulence factor BrkB family protein n=2 Tax=Pseudotabrizicola sediminis TaxID=2486418 RepID=A0ABY2KN16_9RHOB|nr:YihY/virulence factor BrkB family protein [Pseudotabrizicola sediminis]